MTTTFILFYFDCSQKFTNVIWGIVHSEIRQRDFADKSERLFYKTSLVFNERCIHLVYKELINKMKTNKQR